MNEIRQQLATSILQAKLRKAEEKIEDLEHQLHAAATDAKLMLRQNVELKDHLSHAHTMIAELLWREP